MVSRSSLCCFDDLKFTQENHENDPEEFYVKQNRIGEFAIHFNYTFFS